MIQSLGFDLWYPARRAAGDTHPTHPGWPEFTSPVALPSGEQVRLRPLRASDGEEWAQLRILDEPYLRPVEPTVYGNWEAAHSRTAWWTTLHNLRNLARNGVVIPLVIELNGAFAGQVTLGNIQHGGISECWIGYWVFSGFTGLGLATAACALGVDHAFQRVGMHRVTATYMPENEASKHVLGNNGFRQEGYQRRNLHINGAWQDHCLTAIVVDDYPDSCVERLKEAGRIL